MFLDDSPNSVYAEGFLRLNKAGHRMPPPWRFRVGSYFIVFYRFLTHCERFVSTRRSVMHVFVVKRDTFEHSFVQMALEPPALQMTPKWLQNDSKMIPKWHPNDPPNDLQMTFKCFNIPISHIPIFQYSNVPIFQYSDIPMFQYFNIPIFQ